MSRKRLPLRDPRTVARDMPGVLDILFPRLSGGLVSSLNRKMFLFDGVEPVPDELVEKSPLQKAMIFELSMVRAESILRGEGEPSWEHCLQLASRRQRRHYDAQIPDKLDQCDMDIAVHAAHNLVTILRKLRERFVGYEIEVHPSIPGIGWISSGAGDFSLGPTLIEVKNTDRNFVANDFRQVMMYWLLKYSDSIEKKTDVWTDVILLNPRRNCCINLKFDYLLRSASANNNRVELLELLRSVVGEDLNRW